MGLGILFRRSTWISHCPTDGRRPACRAQAAQLSHPSTSYIPHVSERSCFPDEGKVRVVFECLYLLGAFLRRSTGGASIYRVLPRGHRRDSSEPKGAAILFD